MISTQVNRSVLRTQNRLIQYAAKRTITFSQVTVELKKDDTDFNNRPPKEELVFGKTMSDHMLMIDWDVANKWGAPRIVPREDLKISPAASCLHYGTYLFFKKLS
jgi:hypothetical protein